MSSFNELLQSYVNRDYDDLVDLARSAVDDLMPMLQRTQTEVNAGVLVYSAIMAAVAADGKLTPLENKFLRDVLSFTDEEINIMLNNYYSGIADAVDAFFDNATTDIKAAMLVLVTATAAIDEKISREETAYIKRLMA